MNESELTRLLGPVVARYGLELDAVELKRAGRRLLVRLSLDGDGPGGGGPSLDQISDASKAISRSLDDAPDLTGDAPYVLEVGSRGVHRPLTRPAHYRRAAGRLLECRLQDGTSVTGRVGAADETSVTLDVGDGRRQIPYDRIARAVVQVELGRLPSDASGEE
ncbi:MAG: ribosome maturation factor RimP [Actinomycetia bacterium]|nr:ribosome maturation factor RimP [Actinomycetes bacterium]